MKKSVHPSTFEGVIEAPPSKSVMLRVVAGALLSGDAPTRITNPSFCDDALAGLSVAKKLGAGVDVRSAEVLLTGGLRARDHVLDCGESGFCLRMFTALAALLPEEITLTGSPPLLRRPATAVEAPLAALGATCRTRDGFPPVTVRGPLAGGEAVVDGTKSSQFLSGLLFALPRVAADSLVVAVELASRPYVKLTLDVLDRFGVKVEPRGTDRFFVSGGQEYHGGDHRIEGDWSAAAFLLALGAVAGRVRVAGLDPDSAQADRQILDVLEEAGATVVRHPDGAEASRTRLRGFTFDVTDAPDLLPPLAALACHSEGETVLRGIGRLRFKESDRADAIARELSGLGARLTTDADSLTIRGGPLPGGEGDAHGDHRVAMALAVAAAGARGPVTIEGTEHVAKSYPGFFTDLTRLGGRVLDGASGGPR